MQFKSEFCSAVVVSVIRIDSIRFDSFVCSFVSILFRWLAAVVAFGFKI